MFSVAPVPAIQWSWPLIRNLCAFVTRVIRYFLLGSPHKHPTINTVHCIRKIVPLNSFFLFSTLWQNAITHRLHTHHHTIINQKFKALHPFTSYLFMKKKLFKDFKKIKCKKTTLHTNPIRSFLMQLYKSLVGGYRLNTR